MPKVRRDIPGELTAPSQEFRAASDRIGFYWWHWDNISRKVRMDEGFVKILGLPPNKDGYPQETIYKNVHPEDMKRNSGVLEALSKGEGALYEIEYRIKNSSGEWKWYFNRGSVLQRDEQGNLAVIGGVSLDISRPFSRLLAMVEEKEKFEFIVKNSNEAIIVIELLKDRAGLVLDGNKAAMDLFKVGEEVLGKPLPDYILNDQVIGKGGTLMNSVFETGFGRIEQKVKMADGEELWLEFTLHAFTKTGENLMIAVVNDKTAGKKAEAALRETERLNQTVVEAANDRIGLFTVEGKPLLMNSAFYETVGYSREEYMHVGQYELTHPDDLEKLQEEAKVLFEKGFSSHEYRIRHKKGHYLNMSAKLVLIRGQEGESDQVLFIIRDISERNRTIKELEEAKERAEESDKLKSAFLANMSHEIRTPMNSIIGFSNLLNHSETNDEQRGLYVHRIISNSELLLTLISDIIDLAKIESDQLSIIYGKVKISELLNDMKQYAVDEAVRLQKAGLEIVVAVDSEDCEIETDVIRMAQVMKNLVNNAIKFTEKGKIEIGCIAGESEATVRFYVKDTGIGISPDHFDVIFEQFRQIDGSNTRKFGGTGLGLAICRNLVRLMGGRIWVESEPGNGASFLVEFPLQSKDVKRELATLISKDSERKSSGKKISLLAVDDEQDTLELYQAMITQMGHQVAIASNGYEALRILELYPLPDLVLMDIQMPVMSGTDTLKIIQDRYPELKVVAQSAHALTGDRDRFLAEGFDYYLPKPFTPEELNRVIGELDGI